MSGGAEKRDSSKFENAATASATAQQPPTLAFRDVAREVKSDVFMRVPRRQPLLSLGDANFELPGLGTLLPMTPQASPPL